MAEGNDTSPRAPFNKVSTLKICFMFRRQNTKDTGKTKVANKGKQESLTVFQMNDITTLKGGKLKKKKKTKRSNIQTQYFD